MSSTLSRHLKFGSQSRLSVFLSNFFYQFFSTLYIPFFNCRHTASIAAGNHGVPVIVSGHNFGNASGMAPHAQ